MVIARICLLLTAPPVSGASILFNLPDLLTAPCFEVVGSSSFHVYSWSIEFPLGG